MEFFKKDFFQINKSLIPMKLSLFTFPASLMIIQTYLNIYLEDVGLTFSQIAIINTIAPVFQFFGGSFVGAIADKTGKPKLALYASLVATLVSVAFFPLLLYPGKTLPVTHYMNCTLVTEANRNTTDFDSVNFDHANCSWKISNVTSRNSKELCAFDNKTLCSLSKNNKRNNHSTISCCSIGYDEIEHYNTNGMIKQLCDCNQFNLVLEVQKTDDGHMLLFVLAMIITIAYKVSEIGTYFILDTTAVNMSEICGSKYGIQRAWLAMGYVCLIPIGGWILEKASTGTHKRYYTVFIIFEIFGIATLFCVYKLNVKVKPPIDNFLKQIYHLLKGVDFMVLTLVVFALSVTWGFKYEYVSMYLDDLKASSFLLGLGPMVTYSVGLPFLFTSDWWLSKFGSERLLICAFGAYALYYLSYSYMTNPWWSLLCETTGIFYYHLMWVSVVRRNNDVTSQALRATTLTFLGSLHFGLGSSLGSIFGGFIMDRHGGQTACRVLATFSFICGILYACYVWGRSEWLRIRHKYDDDKDVQSEATKEKLESDTSTIPCYINNPS